MESYFDYIHEFSWVSTFLVFLCTFLLVFFSTRRQPGVPPGPMLLPVIGNLHNLIGSDVQGNLKKLRQRYGDVIGLYIGKELTVFLNGYDVLNNALVKHGRLFSSRPMSEFHRLANKYHGIFFSVGKDWKEQRTFSLNCLQEVCFQNGGQNLENIIQDELDEMIGLLGDVDKPVVLDEYIHTSIGNVICMVLHRKRFDFKDKTFNTVLHYLRELTEEFTTRAAITSCFPFLNNLPGDVLGIRRMLSKAEWIRSVFWPPPGRPEHGANPLSLLGRPDNGTNPVNLGQSEKFGDSRTNLENEEEASEDDEMHFNEWRIQSNRRLSLATEYRPKTTEMSRRHSTAGEKVGTRRRLSVTDLYLDKIDSSGAEKTGSSFTEERMQSTLYDLRAAGIDTTASVLLWAVLYFIRFPEIQARISAEVKKVIGYDNKPTIQDRHDLPFVEAVILEVMRISGVVPFSLPHTVTSDTEFCGYLLPANCTIIANLDSSLKDPLVWDSPLEFRPERFLSDDMSQLVIPKEFIPFSVGPRSCLGESLARIELFLFVTTLLQKFEFLPEIDGAPPEEKGHLGVTWRPNTYKVRLIKRSE